MTDNLDSYEYKSALTQSEDDYYVSGIQASEPDDDYIMDISECSHTHKTVTDAVNCFSRRNRLGAGPNGDVAGLGIARHSDGRMLNGFEVDMAMRDEAEGV